MWSFIITGMENTVGLFSTIRSNSIGQGEVKLTPLQMANLAAIVANEGFYYEPHLVKSIGNEGPQEKFKVKNTPWWNPNILEL